MYKTVVPKLIQGPDDAERMYHTLKLSSVIDLVCRHVVQGYYMIVGFSTRDSFTVKYEFSDARSLVYDDSYAGMSYSSILPPEVDQPSIKSSRDKTIVDTFQSISSKGFITQ
jgi:hypothetical protein